MLATMKIYHSDHGVSIAMLEWAIGQITAPGFFLRTFELPAEFADLSNALYGPASGDAPIGPEAAPFYAKRSPDRPLSRMVPLPKRPTRLLTVIGVRADGEESTIYTAYGGPVAEREPGDPTLTTDEEKADAEAFWSQHALANPWVADPQD